MARGNILKQVKTASGWRNVALRRDARNRIKWTSSGRYIIEWQCAWTLAGQLACAATLLRVASNVASLSSRLVSEACAISGCLSWRNIG